MDAIEREENQLEKELSEGRITRQEYNCQMRDLQRDYQDQAREAAWQAFERELGRW
jgi:hypothetical protein